jgi:hypothetical protein
MKTKISFLLVIILTFTAFGCGNTYSSLANKTSDDAIYEEVLKSVDNRDWNEALAQINSLSAGKKSEPDVIETWAGIFAGQCGLDFISYFDSISSASLVGSSIFKYLMNAFTQKAVNPGACLLAQQKMEEISTDPLLRTDGENLFMAILGMFKIGTYLLANADVDGTGSLGNGTADAGYNSCNSASISDADVTQVITGIGLVTTNLTALTSVISSGSITTALTNISAACGATCQKTAAADVAPADIILIRDILRTGPSTVSPDYQLGVDDVCDASDGATLLACCP